MTELSQPSDNEGSGKDSGFRDFLAQEYQYVTRLFVENEQLGERRVELFITLTTAVLTLLGALSTSGSLLIGKDVDPRLFLIGLLVPLPFGIVTLRRMIERNIETDKNTTRLDTIRRYFIKDLSDPSEKAAYLPFHPDNPKPPHMIEPGLRPLLSLRKGGLLESVALVNTFVFAGLAISLFSWFSFEAQATLVFLMYGSVGLLVLLAGWLGQMIYVRRKYDDEIVDKAAAGGFVWRVSNGSMKVAVVRRTRYDPDEWTLPKGKLEQGEGWKDAAIREVCEEIGCSKEDLRVVNYAGKICYPVGQATKVVLFWNMTLRADARAQARDTEVRGIDWLPKTEAVERLVHDKEGKLLGKQVPPRNEKE